MDQVWTWDQDVPLRWLLIDEGSSGVDGSDVPMALCAEVDGLFVDPEPPAAPEHYTLIGCEPAGSLCEALRHAGTDRAWLARVVLDPVHDPQDRPGGCQSYSIGCSCMEELFDVTVLGRRPSAVGPGLMDIDLRGHLRILEEMHWPPAQPPAAQKFVLTGLEEEPLGHCLRTSGIFRERPRRLVPPVTLIGCRPEPPLQALTGRKSARRRYLRAMIHAVDHSGRDVDTGQMVSATVIGSRPSSLGTGLVDVILDEGLYEPLPSGAREIWDLWHGGRPTRANLWAGYDRALRHEWSGAALHHRHHGQPDRPAGYTYHLDGRFVTDIEGFYCAMGEAINGPGGYFGWNLDALADCLRGRWGAARPFRLIWHHSDVARRHLVPGYDRPSYSQRSWGPAITLQDLLDILVAESGIDVDMR